MRFVSTIIFALLLGCSAWASHIVGGNITVTPNANNHTLRLILYYDELTPGTIRDNVTISIFRKRDQGRERDFVLDNQQIKELPFGNSNCVSGAKIKMMQVSYSLQTVLNLNEAEGYYVVWEQCCRGANLHNIQGSGSLGFVFYTEISPTTIRNTTPEFKTPKIEFICQNKPFQMDFGATDADGDELRYALVTPLRSFSTTANANPIPRQGPYSDLQWANGFDKSKPITGTLKLDEKTGLIDLTATQTGQYAVTIRCEEYRNNAKVGETRQDWVFIVSDCATRTIAEPIIELKSASPSVNAQLQPNKQLIAATICAGDSATLKANDEDTRWAYQWQLDGKDIGNATKVIFTARQAGNYTLIKKYKDACPDDKPTTATTKISFKTGSNWKLTSSKKIPICNTDSTSLDVTPSGNYLYRWQRDGQTLTYTGGKLQTKQAGLYKVLVTDNGSQCSRLDSIVLKVVDAPTAKLIVSGPTAYCSSDSSKIIGAKNPAYNYLWTVNNEPIFEAIGNEWVPKKSGKYVMTVTDTASLCLAQSDAIAILIKPAPVVTFDSIPPLCGEGTQAVTLKVTPAGGTFEGRSVLNGRFVSLGLPPGKYPVTYSFTNTDGCTARQKREITIMQPPRIKLPPTQLGIIKGQSIEIRTAVPENAIISWTPSTGLDNPMAATVLASPERTTIYKISIKTAEGCTSEAEVEVQVIDLEIPNGFSPNDDGINDTWQIARIKDYPNCIVEIYNRWGNVLYKSRGYESPWDGTWNNTKVAIGTYYYRLYFGGTELSLSGNLTVLK